MPLVTTSTPLIPQVYTAVRYKSAVNNTIHFTEKTEEFCCLLLGLFYRDVCFVVTAGLLSPRKARFPFPSPPAIPLFY